MKITVLMENTAYKPEFAVEHGLSLHIETSRHNILFDTGQTEAFADNAALLGVDLREVDIAVLSHGHYDHGGGIKRFLAINDHAPVYLSRNAFGQHYNASGKYIGLDPDIAGSGRLVYTDDFLRIDDELELCTCNRYTRKYPTDSAVLTVQRNDVPVPENFLHEQYLVIHDGKRRVVISGCSHKGILNIMDWLQPDILVGGFHFMKQPLTQAGNPVLDHAAEVLSGFDTEYYTCHCTGQEQYEYLKEKMGERLHYLASGQILEI